MQSHIQLPSVDVKRFPFFDLKFNEGKKKKRFCSITNRIQPSIPGILLEPLKLQW